MNRRHIDDWIYSLTNVSELILYADWKRRDFDDKYTSWGFRLRNAISLIVIIRLFFRDTKRVFFYMNSNHDLTKRKYNVFHLSSCLNGDFLSKYDKYRIFFWTNKVRSLFLILTTEKVALTADNNYYISIDFSRFFLFWKKKTKLFWLKIIIIIFWLILHFIRRRWMIIIVIEFLIFLLKIFYIVFLTSCVLCKNYSIISNQFLRFSYRAIFDVWFRFYIIEFSWIRFECVVWMICRWNWLLYS